MDNVAILILLELTLQYVQTLTYFFNNSCRNPYFIGINSAICEVTNIEIEEDGSQSLFYWN